MKKLQTKQEEINEGKKLSAGILLAVELESNFKLYSYRCIDAQNYIDRIDQLISIYKKSKIMPAPAIAPFLPLIGTGVSALATGIGNIFGNKSRKKEANRSRAHDINMWDKTNAYNHPSAQMQRLRSAGLNPNLVYGGSSGQTAGTANALPGAKDAKINDITMGENPMMQYVSMKNTQAQTDNLRTQNGVLSAEKNLKTVQAITEASKQDQLKSSAEYNAGLLKKALQDVKKTIQDTEGSRLDNVFQDLVNERAKNGQFPGDNAEKVMLDKILNMYDDLYNGQVPAPWQQFGTGIPLKKG